MLKLLPLEEANCLGQGKPTARISANVSGLSAFRYNPPPPSLLVLGGRGEAEIHAENSLRKAEIRGVNLPRP